jgi:hypothetical protein
MRVEEHARRPTCDDTDELRQRRFPVLVEGAG